MWCCEFVDDSCANAEAAEGIIRYIQSTYVVTTEIFLCSETEHDFSVILSITSEFEIQIGCRTPVIEKGGIEAS